MLSDRDSRETITQRMRIKSDSTSEMRIAVRATEFKQDDVRYYEDKQDGSKGARRNKVAKQGLVPQNQPLQQIKANGKILVGKKGWALRIVTLSIIELLLSLTFLRIPNDPIAIYSSFMLVISLMTFSAAWLCYLSPIKEKSRKMAKSIGQGQKVSVIVPIYNQESMIENVIDALYDSSYRNIEIIAVNDGSTDGTGKILDHIKKAKHTGLQVIHKKNGGKRSAVAAGFMNSKGKYIVLIDSDSVIHKHALSELVLAFESNPNIGGLAGEAKIWNSNTNILTRWQDSCYDYAFNILKAAESSLGKVSCCPGCLSAYRREAIADYIEEYWPKEEYNGEKKKEDGRKKRIRQPLKGNGISSRLLHGMAQYDDCDDSSLTAYCLRDWDTAYLPSAIVYTDVPDTLTKFYKQQLRWKKGYLRSALFASTFMWKKGLIASLLFYSALINAITLPAVTVATLYNDVFVLHQVWTLFLLIGASSVIGFLAGIDYRSRYANEGASALGVNWKHGALAYLVSVMGLSWLIFPAIAGYRKNVWLTR